MASESVSVTNWPDSGSPERVAFDLMKWLRNTVKTGETEAAKDAYLDLYAECLRATNGLRRIG